MGTRGVALIIEGIDKDYDYDYDYEDEDEHESCRVGVTAKVLRIAVKKLARTPCAEGRPRFVRGTF